MASDKFTGGQDEGEAILRALQADTPPAEPPVDDEAAKRAALAEQLRRLAERLDGKEETP